MHRSLLDGLSRCPNPQSEEDKSTGCYYTRGEGTLRYGRRSVSPPSMIVYFLTRVSTAHKKRRQSLSERSLSRVPPNSGEAATLHEFYLSHGREDAFPDAVKPGDERVWMGDTIKEVCQLMLPQERKCVICPTLTSSSEADFYA
jgi:hypothetical protein